MPLVTALLPLCQLPNGSIGRVRELTGDLAFCQRIRELGFVETTLVRKIGGTGPFVCQLNEIRLALGHGAAANILVEPVPRWDDSARIA